MGTDAIIFDLKYTPYKLHKGATIEELKKHREERAFYDLSGDKNIYGYMTTEEKTELQKEKKFTALEYLEKNRGVFNQNGLISKEELEQMKIRAKENKGLLWHGFISLSENDSPKIDSVDKCVALVSKVFKPFFKEGSFKESNIDLMCSLHSDKPHHLHIHFCYWEKEPTILSRDGTNKEYRAKGKVNKKAIDNVYVRVTEFLDEQKNNAYQRRDEALKELKGLVKFRNVNASSKDVFNEILALKQDLPKTGRYSYGAEEMKPYRARVDKIVSMLLESNGEARNADIKFYEELERKRKLIKGYINEKKKFDDGSGKFRYQIDEKNITVIEDIEKDYKRRQGNLVLNLIKAIDPEYYERSKKWKYETNCKKLKRSLTISKRKVKSIFQQFFLTFGVESLKLERDFSHRLQEIEEDMEREREKQNKLSKGGNIKD